MSATHRKPNRLINEISPYLLQHAYNPVDWFPWSNEAFEKAAGEDKLVFLSIGYSTCHWCHVMEGESFEDEEIAEFLNESFVPIKVDREERPDLDNIYMTACQIMNGSGGWPLSVFMTPEKKPFFAGTYFPKKSGYGRIGFKELLKSITDAWKSNRSGIISGAQEFTLHLGEAYSPGADTQLSPQILDDAYSAFEKQFDSVNGGFGSAPKFPSPHNLMFLMRYRKRTGNDNSLQMVIKTLTEMRQGGIFDQIGFGFHRYSTDSKWFAPHFEKMLYDQALLIMAYTEAYQITGKDLFKRTVGEISAYVLRDMSSPEGGFYSAEDADSEGSEGKFYLWSEDELYSLLGSEDAEFAQRVFNTSKDGNFAEPDHKFSGTNILHRKSIRQESVNDETRLENIRVKLFGERENRVHPHKDDKLLTDWNGLMIAALAKAGRVFGNGEYVNAAERALGFVAEYLTSPDGKLLHRFGNGKSGLTASHDDYSFIIWALLELYESTFKIEYIDRAVELTGFCIEHFWDEETGGFFFTPDYGEKLIVRTKEFYDGAVPSGNSVSALNLLRLSRITADAGYGNYAGRILSSASHHVSKNPQAYSQMLQALDYSFGPSYEIIIAGDIKNNKTKAIISKLSSEFIPNKVVILKDRRDQNFNPSFKYLQSYSEIDAGTAVYLCKDYACSLPVTEAEELLKLVR